MTREEAIQEIANILETDVEEVKEENILTEYDAWDSIAVLSVISLVSDNKGLFLHASDISKLNKVSDLVNLLV